MKKGVIAACAAVIFAIPISLFAYSKYINHDLREAPTSIDNCKDPAVSSVIYSLRKYPTRWASDEYTIEHISGVTVWTANQEHSLSIGIDKNTTLPNQYPLTNECRKLLYSTILKWNKTSLNEKIRN